MKVIPRLFGGLSALVLALLSGCSGAAGNSALKPQGLSVWAPMSSHVSLHWKPVEGASSYKVYRGWSFLPALPVAQDLTQPFYEDSDLRTRTEYVYEVSAVVGGQEGPRASAKVTTSPPVVSTLKTTSADRAVDLEWKPSEGATAYLVIRDSGGAPTPSARFTVPAVPGSQDPVRYHDSDLEPGVTYYYIVAALGPDGEDDGGVSRAVAGTAGGTAAPVPSPSSAVNPVAPVLKARSEAGAVALSWADQGPGVSYTLTRQIAGGPESVIDEGLVGSHYLDLSDDTAPRTYRLHAGSASGPVSAPVSAAALSRGTPLLWDHTVSFGVEEYPVQSAEVHLADASQPARAVFLITGRSRADLPGLMAVLDRFNVLVVNPQRFNFGTTDKPVYLTTKMDPNHPILVMDYRWAKTSSQLLQSLFDEVGRQLPQHPEVPALGVITYGFSQASVDNTKVLGRPEWDGRRVANISIADFGSDRSLPVAFWDGVPSVFLASGLHDEFSSLNVALLDVPQITHEDYGRHLVANRGMPLTVVNNIGASHGQKVDHPLLAQWLAPVLAQRLGGPLESWNRRVGWSATYTLDLTHDAPWGTAKETGVRMKDPVVAPGRPAEGTFLWLPGKTYAQVWQRNAATGQE